MKLVTNRFTYNECDLDTVKKLIDEGNIFPVVFPTIVEEDGEDYPDFQYDWYLKESAVLSDGVIIEKVFYFFEHKEEVRKWLRDCYNGLVYTD